MANDPPSPNQADAVADPPEPTVDRSPWPAMALALGTTAGDDGVAQLAPEQRAELAATAVSLARAVPNDDWLNRLTALRRVLLIANHRDALAMVLQAQADVALGLGRADEAVEALDTLVGVRELLGQPARSHMATLAKAAALAAAGRGDEAESTWFVGLERAQALARTVDATTAADHTARTMLALGRWLLGQDRASEARTWLAGAEDVAVDSALRHAAGVALAGAGHG